MKKKKTEKIQRPQAGKPNAEGDNIVLHVACEHKVLCHNFNLTPKLNEARSKQARTQKTATTFDTIE